MDNNFSDLPADFRLSLDLAYKQTEEGEFELASIFFRHALTLAPDRVDVLSRVAGFLAATDALSESIALYDRALEIDPNNAALWVDSAVVHEAAGCADQAEWAYRRALELKPDCVTALTRLGEILRYANRREEALAAHRRALAISPGHAESLQNLGMLLVDLTRLEEAETAFKDALAQRPNFPVAMSNLLFSMGFTLHWPAATMRAWAAEWEVCALSAADRQAARARGFSRRPLARRPLRLGILSSELGHHAVGFFLWSWLRRLNQDRCDLFLYPTRLRPEPQAASFKALTSHWTPVAGLSDAQAAERIRLDEIDVLIETSGHTKHNRLGIIAHRAAPVQCHYIGYFTTTGLSEMDYFLGDPVFTPPDCDAGFTETVWRLPRSRYAFEPLVSAPEPRWQPDPKGRLWLGSFNQLTKVREDSLRLWSRILRGQPNAHLLLKDNRAEDPAVQTRIRASLGHLGVAPERVMFVGHTPLWSEHMGLYNFVDLALDPVPFTSATTGFEALWMGTPLVTLRGDQPAARQAASMLSGLGRTDWIAEESDAYVRIALDLLRDVELRRQLRVTLRARMQGSELCDGGGLAAVLQDTFEQMYRRWESKR